MGCAFSNTEIFPRDASLPRPMRRCLTAAVHSLDTLQKKHQNQASFILDFPVAAVLLCSDLLCVRVPLFGPKAKIIKDSVAGQERVLLVQQ